MTHLEIRNSFAGFFKRKGHKSYASLPLVPPDPTLLFTTAGMVQFKDAFLGNVKLDPPRACSVQKCVRTSDIDRIGSTSRHLTFFEMLGNFSFGDYFKKEAIAWAWEFLTREMNLDPARLYATVYEDDEEALKIWKEFLPEKKVYRLGKDSNFWEMGETGPCGPCSEIIYDLGEKISCGKNTCAPGCDCDRFLEVWNLVFTQFDRQKDGTLIPLKQKNIDTGMGLERLTEVSQNKTTPYDTDLLSPLLDWAREEMPPSAKLNEKSLRIVADHLRSSTFLIHEGIIPENTGRGYVLRRLLRRAVCHAKKLGADKPVLWKGTEAVLGIFSDIYPEMTAESSRIQLILKAEEENFFKTL
ncbi:MAG TPA: alanine--tRNA ligase-related protein, partial [bacterium]|nr:alanine--tRNA ligase-related protein [bacterium]